MELRSLSKTSVRVVGRGMAIVVVRDQSKSVYYNDVLGCYRGRVSSEIQ